MDAEGKIPILFTLLFGEAAEMAQRGASERLGRWAAGFDEWLAERDRIYGRDARKQAVLSWRRLLRQCSKMPWELTAGDIEGHAEWMRAKNYSPNTIYAAQGFILKFYNWCSGRQLDPEWQAGPNPGAGVQRSNPRRYKQTRLLSREELSRLLRTLQRDPSVLGKRDYAFILARLRLGVSLRSLQQLTWGQIEQEGEATWVRWHAGAERQKLPAEAWEAIRAALEAGGRLAGMQRQDFIFAPLAEPSRGETGNRAEDWLAGRCVSTSALLASLKLYGRLAGIEAGKLTFMALRSTATRLQMEEGASLEEMRTFLDSHEEMRLTKHRLGRLPQLPPEAGNQGPDEGQVGIPNRKAKPFMPGEGMTHGLYARSLPPDEVAAVAAENIQGLDEEIVGLRILERGLLERQAQASNRQEARRLWEAYSLTAHRLGEIIRTERELSEKGNESQMALEVLEKMDQLCIEQGEEPDSAAERAEAPGSEIGLEAANRILAEEIAGMRYCLRRVFRLAIESKETDDTVRYTDIYSSTCVRLARLLKVDKASSGKLEAYLRGVIERAIARIVEEQGLY